MYLRTGTLTGTERKGNTIFTTHIKNFNHILLKTLVKEVTC